EDERLVERHAKTVGIFDGRGAGAALRPVNGDKIGQYTGFQHRLADAHKLAPPPDAELEADRLAARQLAQAGDEFEQPLRRREGAVRRWREHVLADGNAADARYFLIHLDAKQDAAMRGLGALAQLQRDHLDDIPVRLLAIFLGIEAAILGTAAEIAGADLPDKIAAARKVIGADAPLPGVM